MKLTPYFDYFKAHTDTDEQVLSELVLLHGWGLHSQIWDNLMPDLLARFNVTLIDLPGMGRSPVANEKQSLSSIVNTIQEVLPPKAFVMGWSLGALVGMQLAQEYPEKVLGLINISMGPCFSKQAEFEYGVFSSELDDFESWFREDWQGTLTRFLALQCKGSNFQLKELHLLKHLVFFHGLPSQRALLDCLSILREANFIQWLKIARTPILFLFGENDALIDASAAQAIKKVNPIITAHVIKQAGHIPFLSFKNIFLKIIEAWLARQISGKKSFSHSLFDSGRKLK